MLHQRRCICANVGSFFNQGNESGRMDKTPFIKPQRLILVATRATRGIMVSLTPPREAQKISVVPTSLFSPAQTWKPDEKTAQNVNIL